MPPPKIKNRRLHFVYGGLLVFALILAGRLSYLQIAKADELREKASKQQAYRLNLDRKRGMILDRNGRELALDLRAYSLFAQPREFKIPREAIATKLAPILKQPYEEVLKDLQGEHFRYLVRKMDDATYRGALALSRETGGLGFEEESKRIYPQRQLAGTLLGFVGMDNQGLAGLEYSFDTLLRGEEKGPVVFTDALKQELLRLKDEGTPLKTAEADGNRIYLTLDIVLQHIVQRELEKGMEKTKADRAAAIVLDVSNGDILAMATTPALNPNEYRGATPEALKNWSVTDTYEPGSTMKIFTLAAALEAGKTFLSEYVPCPGQIKVESWRVSDHDVSAGRVRMLQPIDIIEQSSNVGTSLIARRMSDEQHRDLLLKFGFGQRTRSNLSGEVAGTVLPLPWRPSLQSTISFGYGITVTPLQIASAMSAVANNGVRVQPRIVEKIVAPDGRVLQSFIPGKTQTISPKVADEMKQLMTAVVHGKHGTGRAARIPGYTIAGKTGTAHKAASHGGYDSNVIASFIGFLPVEKPKFLIFVLVDSPHVGHYASETAVPIFYEIAKNALLHSKTPMTRPEELTEKDKS